MKIPDFLKKNVSLSIQTENDIIAAFKREELPEGSYLFKQGSFCQRIFFIEKGMARFFYLTESGKDVTAWFFTENSFLTTIDSFYHNRPTDDCCILLEDSIIYSISFDDFRYFLDNNPEAAKFCFYVLFNFTQQITQYASSFKFQAAEDRYAALQKNYPEILKRASLGQISSYLGISQETLSRIRSGKKT